jgi:hypothetical protein
MNDRYNKLVGSWKAQETPPTGPGLDVIKSKAGKFRRQVFWRNVREWSAAAFVAPFFLFLAWFFPGAWLKAGALTIVAACVYVSYRLYNNGRAQSPADLLSLTTARYQEAFRGQLLDQARLLRWAPLWYVAPFTVGYALMGVGYAMRGDGLFDVVSYAALGVVVFVAVSVLNLYAARGLTRKANALDFEA